MKKILLLFLVIFLTGCDKVLKCERVINSDTIVMGENQKIYYNGDSIVKIETIKTYDVKESQLKENFPILLSNMETDYYSNDISFDEKIKGDSYKLKVTFIPKDYSDELLEKLMISKNFGEYNKKLLDDGFNCK